MFDRANDRNIWVHSAAENGDGSIDAPFNSIQEAVDKAQPGETVILLPGEYSATLSVNEKSGEEQKPITITGDSEGGEIVVLTEWYFYSVSDFIVTNLAFKDTANSAISIVGESKRNIFKNIDFLNCGSAANCTLFTGGSGGESNVFEKVTFSMDEANADHIGIMLSQSKDDEDESIKVSKQSVVRYASFNGMGTAVLAGSGDDIDEYGSPLIEDCLFSSCVEGVRIKANGTAIKGSIFRNCDKAIVHIEGVDVDVTDNRIEQCKIGVSCFFGDITIHENCLVDAGFYIDVETCGLPVIIHNNTMVFAGESPVVKASGEGEFYGMLSDNLFYNGTLSLGDGLHGHENVSNLSSDGTVVEDILFANSADGDYSSDRIAGCKTAACSRREIEMPESVALSELAKEVGFTGDDIEGSVEKREVFLKSIYPDIAQEEEETEEDFEDEEDYFNTFDE